MTALTADPAAELIDARAVESPHDPALVHHQQRRDLSVEVLPVLAGSPVAVVDLAHATLDPQVVQVLAHDRGVRLAAPVVDDCLHPLSSIVQPPRAPSMG